MAKKDLTKVISSQRKHLDSVTQKKVVDELLDELTLHALQLQQISNNQEAVLGKFYKDLSDDLLDKVNKYDFYTAKGNKLKAKRIRSLMKEGAKSIETSHKLIKQAVRDGLISVGDLETQFAIGSLNKAATGSGTIQIATETLSPKKISTIADNLIVEGIPQSQVWSRQTKRVQEKFKDAVRMSYQNNEDIETLSGRIRGSAANKYKDGIINVSKNQANTLARTSISSVSNRVREETYLANTDVIKGVQFLAHLDSNTTAICRAYSGDQWVFEDGGYRNIEGGHEFRQPPLHFNCRSTMLPLLKTSKELELSVPKKWQRIPNDKRKTVGKPLGPKVCHSPCTYRDADEWLKSQDGKVRKQVLGSDAAVALWEAGKVTMSRFVTQKGRSRTPEEVANLYAQKELVPETVLKLKSTDKFKANSGASKEAAERIALVEKGKFLTLEGKLQTGRNVSKTDKDLMGYILKNADASEFEYNNAYAPVDFKDFIGNRGKRLAFYNHTAKRFERIEGLRKGDLSLRSTAKLNDTESLVYDEIISKISKDTKITSANREILLEIFEESKDIVGTKRSVPMIESLLTVARSENFSFIEGEFVGYMNNALKNSVNSYFSRLVRAEMRTTDSLEKLKRYALVSESGKKTAKASLNQDKKGLFEKAPSLAESTKYKKRIVSIGNRNLRSFAGQTATELSVDLGLNVQDSLSLYFGLLQDGVRMRTSSITKFGNRIKSKEVQFIISRTNPGEKILINDAILNNAMFAKFKDKVFSGRGLPPELRDELGQYLQDAQMYQDARLYMKGKVKVPDTEIPDIFIRTKLDDFLKEGMGPVNVSFVTPKIDKLYNMDAAKRVKERERIAKKAKKELGTEGAFSRLLRREKSIERIVDVRETRRKVGADWELESDGPILRATNDNILEDIEKDYRKPNSPFYKEANLLKNDDPVELARLTNEVALASTQKGSMYIQAVKKLGEQYYYKFHKILDPEEDDALRIGNYLMNSLVKTGNVKRLKSVQLIKADYQVKEVTSWTLKADNPEWETLLLENKKNYDVDGLPRFKAPKYGRGRLTHGLYEDTGEAAIRGSDKDWVELQYRDGRSKASLDNLDSEAGTAIRVNGYTYDVLTKLRSNGDEFIPSPPKMKRDVVSRSKYDSFNRALTTARGLRDQKFYNGMSNDKYGRTYSNATALQWQGDDFNRGLMLFDNAVEMGKDGMDHYKQAFMNIAGFDKIPLRERNKLYDLMDDELILKTAADPFANDWWRTKSDWISTGVFRNLRGIDVKYKIPKGEGGTMSVLDEVKKLAVAADPRGDGAVQLLAMIKERAEMIEWTRAGNKLSKFKSRIPVQIDGTTNVLQHIAAISRDKSTAAAVNMTKRNGVADAYIKTRDAVETLAKTKYKDDPIVQKYVFEGMSHSKRRKSVKKGLMTSQYNAGPSTLGESYFEALKGTEVNGELLFDRPTVGEKLRIGRLILEASENEFPEGFRTRTVLNELAEAHTLSGKTEISMRTPNVGNPFRMSYFQDKTRQVELDDGAGGRISVEVRVETDEMNWSKQERAFAPNIIHAFDAEHKSLVVNAMAKQGVKDFSMIHDSFGAHAGNMSLMKKATKQAFVKMYKNENILEKLYKHFKSQGVEMVKYSRDEFGRKIKVTKKTVLSKGQSTREVDGRTWVIEDINKKDILELGGYNFEDFDELDYFFH